MKSTGQREPAAGWSERAAPSPEPNLVHSDQTLPRLADEQTEAVSTRAPGHLPAPRGPGRAVAPHPGAPHPPSPPTHPTAGLHAASSGPGALLSLGGRFRIAIPARPRRAVSGIRRARLRDFSDQRPDWLLPNSASQWEPAALLRH